MSEHEDKLKGHANKTAGSFKSAAGEATDDRELQAEGEGQKAKGSVQNIVGELKGIFSKK